MRRLLVLGVLAGAAAVAWQLHQRSHAPLQALEGYADALARGRHDLARAFATGDLTGAETGERHAAAGWVPVQELRGSAYRVEARSASADGSEVELTVMQTVGFNPPGVESALRPAMKATFRLRATVRRTGDGWKVAAFASEFLGSDETAAGP